MADKSWQFWKKDAQAADGQVKRIGASLRTRIDVAGMYEFRWEVGQSEKGFHPGLAVWAVGNAKKAVSAWGEPLRSKEQAVREAKRAELEWEKAHNARLEQRAAEAVADFAEAVFEQRKAAPEVPAPEAASQTHTPAAKEPAAPIAIEKEWRSEWVYASQAVPGENGMEAKGAEARIWMGRSDKGPHTALEVRRDGISETGPWTGPYSSPGAAKSNARGSLNSWMERNGARPAEMGSNEVKPADPDATREWALHRWRCVDYAFDKGQAVNGPGQGHVSRLSEATRPDPNARVQERSGREGMSHGR